MDIKINFKYAKGAVDTKDMVLVDISGRKKKGEHGACLCIQNGANFVVAKIETGDLDSSNALCKEIVRRFNEFPEELKQ